MLRQRNLHRVWKRANLFFAVCLSNMNRFQSRLVRMSWNKHATKPCPLHLKCASTTLANLKWQTEPSTPCLLVVLDSRVGHTMDVLSPFIFVFCHPDWLFHWKSWAYPRIDVVHPGPAWSSSPACTWLCSLHYLFFQATPFFPHGVTIVCKFPCFDSV